MRSSLLHVFDEVNLRRCTGPSSTDRARTKRMVIIKFGANLIEAFISVVCIAGAGRGPLVARCLTALERAHREAVVYAVEKNPNAYVTYASYASACEFLVEVSQFAA